jgi:hypothetical protein
MPVRKCWPSRVRPGPGRQGTQTQNPPRSGRTLRGLPHGGHPRAPTPADDPPPFGLGRPKEYEIRARQTAAAAPTARLAREKKKLNPFALRREVDRQLQEIPAHRQAPGAGRARWKAGQERHPQKRARGKAEWPLCPAFLRFPIEGTVGNTCFRVTALTSFTRAAPRSPTCEPAPMRRVGRAAAPAQSRRPALAARGRHTTAQKTAPDCTE